jgi:hypothetical protein
VLVLAVTGFGMAREIAAPQFDAAALDQYCSVALELDRYSHPSPGYEMLTNTEQFNIARQLAGLVEPFVDALVKTAPPEVEADVRLVRDGVRDVAQSGDFRILGIRGAQAPVEDAKLGPRAARIRAAVNRLHHRNVALCDWNPVPVQAVDFRFDLPPTLPAGLTSFELHNSGAAPHEMAVERLNDPGADPESLLEELEAEDRARAPGALPGAARGASGGIATYLGEAFAPSGNDDNLVLDLRPGTYLLVCLVPTGTIYVSEQNEKLGTGPPHARLGMIRRFRVR